jgi:ribosome-binding protein aMBF1 (putative translation factor)
MARNWKDVRADAVSGGLVDEERVTHATKALGDAVQAQRLADIRKAQVLDQQTLAKRMKVSQARVSKIEHGTLTHTEVGTLESYVEALGGRLRVVAEDSCESLLGVDPSLVTVDVVGASGFVHG